VTDIWTFLTLTVLLTLSPGPDDVLVLRTSLDGGVRRGLAAVGGVAVGSLAWGLAAALGLATVVARSDLVYDGLRLVGACYLVLLGAGQLRAEVRRRPRAVVAVGPVQAPGGSGRAFSAGLLSDVLNPKIGLFYLAVVPQFVPAGDSALQYAVLLCAIDVAVAVTWLAALAWLAHVAVGRLRRPSVVRWSPRVLSVVLVGLGVSTAVGF
jgi:threonine/homoserine/homoserine lactone efflux protein